MQSPPGYNMPCVSASVHNVKDHNDRNDRNNNNNNMTTSPVPTAHSSQTTMLVSPSLVSNDSYPVFPSCSDNMDMLAVPYHGDDGRNGDNRGIAAGVGVGVATGHTATSTAITTSAITGASASHYHHYSDKPLDDLDLMLQHQDFPQLVTLAVKVKQARIQVAEACANGGTAGAGKTRKAVSALEPSEVIDAVSRLQDQLLAAGPNVNSNGTINKTSRQVIPRGVYPITDSIMDDSLETLQKELDRCYRYLEQVTGAATSNAMATTEASQTTATTTNKKAKAPKKGGKKKKAAIAVKYSKWQTDILMNWMIENKDQPFPDQDEIKNLMRMTGLTHSQVVNWTTNVRKRNRKATCQGGKKPHHFIDFLFLAQDRENRRKKQQAQEQRERKHQQVKAIKVESPDGPPSPYSAPNYHRHFQQEQQPQQRRQQMQQPQQRQHQEAYPSPKQLQSSSVYVPPQEAYPSPKQQQSASIRSMAPADNEYHYHNHHRSSGHPGFPSYPRNKSSDPPQPYGNAWEHAPSLKTAQSGGSGSALEPLCIDDISEVVLLDDFSSFFFEDKPHPNHGNHASNHATTVVKSESDYDMVDVLEYHQHQHHYTMTHQDVHVQPKSLMHSVTDDQDSDTMPDYQHSRSNKFMRVMAVDHVDLDELEDMKIEDINDWAAELGLVVQI